MNDARPIYRSTASWAVSVLRDLGAIQEMDLTGDIVLIDDDEAWAAARSFARLHPLRGSSAEVCLVAIDDVEKYVLRNRGQ